jgi:TadE-like protein
MKRWFRTFRSTEASEIAEMAMVLPVMFLVFLGIFWVGRSYNIFATVNQAAREGARVAALSTCAACSGTPNTPATDAAVVAAVTASLAADHLDINQLQAPNSSLQTPTGCPGGVQFSNPSNISIWRNAVLTAGGTPAECGVVVAFTYPIDLTPIPIMSVLGTVQIQARAQTRVEQ